MKGYTNNSTTGDVTMESMLEAMKMFKTDSVPPGTAVFMNPQDLYGMPPLMEPLKVVEEDRRFKFYTEALYREVLYGLRVPPRVIFSSPADVQVCRDERPAKTGNGSVVLILLCLAVLAAAACAIL